MEVLVLRVGVGRPYLVLPPQTVPVRKDTSFSATDLKWVALQEDLASMYGKETVRQLHS